MRRFIFLGFLALGFMCSVSLTAPSLYSYDSVSAAINIEQQEETHENQG